MQGRIFVVPTSVAQKSEMLRILFGFDVRIKAVDPDNTCVNIVDHDPRKI